MARCPFGPSNRCVIVALSLESERVIIGAPYQQAVNAARFGPAAVRFAENSPDATLDKGL